MKTVPQGKLTKSDALNELKRFIFMLFGSAAYAISTALFLAPLSIVAGGMTGLSVIVNIINSAFPIGATLIVLNIPVLLLGVKYYGVKFTLRCLITTAMIGVFTDLFVLLPSLTSDPVLAALYGGICQGVGIGLFVRYEYSSGGTELLGRVISRWIKFLKIPVCVGILDGIIVISGAIVTKDPSNMLYALIVVFVSTKISEIIITGIEKSKLCFIISDKGEEISKTLLERSPRGITMLNGKGMYTGNEHNVLMTCVKDRQLTQMKQIVKSIDENAFIIINDSKEVQGKGFDRLGN